MKMQFNSGLAFVLFGAAGLLASEAQGQEAVVLLHGLGRSSRGMDPMARTLRANGYTVYAVKYPSRRKSVRELSDGYLAPMVERCQKQQPERIHFVAHSLGGIVLRQYFATNRLENAGRIVMIGPPNRGSEVVDKLGHLALFKWINGPAGQQLGTDDESPPNRLPPPPAEFGVIAGRRSINPILSAIIPGPDDGKVSVASTKLDGMQDFVVVGVAHPFLIRNRKVMALTLSFLRHGHFETDSCQ